MTPKEKLQKDYDEALAAALAAKDDPVTAQALFDRAVSLRTALTSIEDREAGR